MAVWRHQHYFSVSKLVTSYGLVVLFHKKNVFKLPILKNKGLIIFLCIKNVDLFCLNPQKNIINLG